MNRSKKFAINSISAAIYQVVIMIIGFIIPRVMLDVYGSEINGLITSITQFISYFTLVEAGLSSAAIYALYKPLAKQDWDEVSSIVVATKKFYNISGYIFVVLVIILSIFFPFFIDTNQLDNFSIMLLVIVLGGTAAIDFFSLGKYRALLTADQKLYIISWSSTLSVIVNTIIIVILSYLRINIVLVRLIALFSICLRSFLLYYYVKKHYQLNFNTKANDSALNKRWSALYLQILGSIQNGAPVILATIFTTLKKISVFSIYNMVISGISGILSIFTNGLSSSFGDIIAREEYDTLKKSYNEFEYMYYSLISFIFGITFIMILPFVNIYTKSIIDINYKDSLLAFLVTLNALLYNLKTPQGMLVISAGLYKETRIQTTIQGLILIIVGSLLAPSYGIYGIMIGSILSNVYRDIDLLIYIPKKVTKLPIVNTLKKWLILLCEILLLFFISNYFALSVDSYLEWVLYASFFSIIHIINILIFSLIFERNNLYSLFIRIKMLFKKSK
ncbi:MAG: hypothetical protein K2P09_06155 [Erysipelotrichales bacterium]|nr:hypothetical protein [Erysipelotrichales bacterium]